MKGIGTKLRKIGPLLFICKMFALAHPLSMQTHHTFQNPKFFAPKRADVRSEKLPWSPLVRKMSAVVKPSSPLTMESADVLYA